MARLGVDDLQRLFTVLGLFHFIAARAQHGDRDIAHARFILDHKNAAAAGQVDRARLGALRNGRIFRLRNVFRRKGGQVDVEIGALAHHRDRLDIAAGLFDDAEHGGEAKAGAAALFLGGEEGVEDLLAKLFRNAAAGVFHLDQQVVAVFHIVEALGLRLAAGGAAGADRQPSAVAV